MYLRVIDIICFPYGGWIRCDFVPELACCAEYSFNDIGGSVVLCDDWIWWKGGWGIGGGNSVERCDGAIDGDNSGVLWHQNLDWWFIGG